MAAAPKHVVVLITAPDRRTARALVKAALAARLVACANLVGGVESHYWWRGSLERSTEILVMFKTMRRHWPALERLVLSLHPYDTPEVVAIDLSRGNQRYLDWIQQSVESKARPGGP
jgi:periplasmic divalent cation tolerance protein